MTKPRTSGRRSSGSRATVPYRAANTPPRSMSPTTMAGKPAALATRRLTMSWSSRLISAGLPAPSQMTTSNRAAGRRGRRGPSSAGRAWPRGRRRRPGGPTGRPSTTTWLVRSPVGLSRMGFMATSGSTPAASACTPWARPISWPDGVTKELSAMFWALNGATLTPRRASSRHRPVTTCSCRRRCVVPHTIRAPGSRRLQRRRPGGPGRRRRAPRCGPCPADPKLAQSRTRMPWPASAVAQAGGARTRT